ncbi:type IV secretion system protein, partial [Myxococcus sp. MISCRS1]|uniref:type IV secretion system protein n=1 Tax=Myxococcus sp. MISCRS1 TaxID=2996786 RepID=UPI002270D177
KGVPDGFKKAFFLGGWAWVIQSYPTLVHVFVSSLIRLGFVAVGRGGDESLMFDPSTIAAYGLDATAVLVTQLGDKSFGDPLAESIVFGLAYLVIIACFFVMAIQVFFAVIEHYLWMCLAGVAMPFGIFKPLAFIAEKAIGGVVSSAFKMMTLALVVGVVEPLLRNLRFSKDVITYNELCAMMLTVGALAFLFWKAPQVAAGWLGGAPSLSAGDTAHTGAAAGQNAAKAAESTGIVDGVKALAGAVGGGAMTTAGVLAQGAKMGAAASEGGGLGARLTGGLGGAFKAAQGALVNGVGGAADGAAGPMMEKFRRGQLAAIEALNPSAEAPGGQSGEAPSTPPTSLSEMPGAKGPLPAGSPTPPNGPDGGDAGRPAATPDAPAWAADAAKQLNALPQSPPVNPTRKYGA